MQMEVEIAGVRNMLIMPYNTIMFCVYKQVGVCMRIKFIQIMDLTPEDLMIADCALAL